LPIRNLRDSADETLKTQDNRNQLWDSMVICEFGGKMNAHQSTDMRLIKKSVFVLEHRGHQIIHDSWPYSEEIQNGYHLHCYLPQLYTMIQTKLLERFISYTSTVLGSVTVDG
jgi:hypothetical protein